MTLIKQNPAECIFIWKGLPAECGATCYYSDWWNTLVSHKSPLFTLLAIELLFKQLCPLPKSLVVVNHIIHWTGCWRWYGCLTPFDINRALAFNNVLDCTCWWVFHGLFQVFTLNFQISLRTSLALFSAVKGKQASNILHRQATGQGHLPASQKHSVRV